MRKIEEIRLRRAANAAARAKAEYDRTHATEKWEAEYQAFVKEQRELKEKKLKEKELANSEATVSENSETDVDSCTSVDEIEVKRKSTKKSKRNAED